MSEDSSSGHIKIKLMGDIAGTFGRREIEVALPQGGTVGELLKRLCDSYGESFSKEVFTAAGNLLPTLVIFVNGEDIKTLQGLDTPIYNSEVEIMVLPIFEGG